MRGFQNIVWEHAAPGGAVMVYGAQPNMLHHKPSIRGALTTASRDGAQPEKICVLAPASTRDDIGFQKIVRPVYWSDERKLQRADGVILTEYSSAVCVPVGDCAVLALVHPKKVVVTHAGRAALTCFSGSNTCTANVVSHAYSFFSLAERAELTAFIMCAIAPEHFRHDDAHGQTLVRPFLETYKENVFVGDPRLGMLDMVKLIRGQCLGYGTPEDKIIWDGLDTYSNPNLASHRQQTEQGVPKQDYVRNKVFIHHQ